MEQIEKQEVLQEVSTVEQMASAIEVVDDASYKNAGEFLKDIKRRQKEIEKKIEPFWRKTYDAYKEINNFKSEALTPFKTAEKAVKDKMSSYMMELERKKREEENRLRELARAEMEAKMREAEEAILNGDDEGAEMARAEASVMEGAMSTTIEVTRPSVDGVAKRKDWEIVSVDPSVVPIEVAGVEIRPVDEKAVMALIRGTKGKITIPGVQYREKVTVTVRV